MCAFLEYKELKIVYKRFDNSHTYMETLVFIPVMHLFIFAVQ
jgi:hypothetical protein